MGVNKRMDKLLWNQAHETVHEIVWQEDEAQGTSGNSQTVETSLDNLQKSANSE